MIVPSDEDIRRRARELWEKDGRPDGKDLDYWLKAARELEDDQDKSKNSNPAEEFVSGPESGSDNSSARASFRKA